MSESMHVVTANDGTRVNVRSVGSGPGVIIVHGGGVTSGIYMRLAQRLSERLTVHLYDRRGRADAAPRPHPYAVEDDVADLDAVMSGTGATSVIGHSVGGYVSLTAALTLPIERLALYDAAVNIEDQFPSVWLPAAQAAAQAGDAARALALTSSGINTHQATSRLPLALQTVLTRAFLRSSIGAQMATLLPSTLEESAEVISHNGPASRWTGISADTLIAYGAAGPRYYKPLSEALHRAIPHATLLPVRRQGHDGINRAPRALVEPLIAFLS